MGNIIPENLGWGQVYKVHLVCKISKLENEINEPGKTNKSNNKEQKKINMYSSPTDLIKLNTFYILQTDHFYPKVNNGFTRNKFMKCILL